MATNPHGESTGKKLSAATSPFQSIFLTTTRPIPSLNSKAIASSSSCCYRPYVILFQHSTKLSQRIIASDPQRSSSSSKSASKSKCVAKNNKTKNGGDDDDDDDTAKIYQNAGIETPKEMSVKDNTGLLFVIEAWKECTKRCHGKVIFVQTSASNTILGKNNISAGASTNTSRNSRRHRDREYESFVSNGAIIDLHSDPMGWDDDANDERYEEDDKNDSKQPTVFKGQTNNLQSILQCISNAVHHINNNNDTTGDAGDKGTSKDDEQQPIPIIFDTITPLLIHHGIHKFTMLLSHIKRSFSSSSTSSSSSNNSKHDKTLNVVSPIFIPTLMEYLPPSSNQVIEDYCDAIISLYGGKLHIAKRSASSGGNGGMIYPGFSGGKRLTKETQSFQLNHKTGDLILLHSKSKSNLDRQKVPLVSPSTTYDNDNESNIGLEKKNEKNNQEGLAESHTFHRNHGKKSSILLQHESDDVGEGPSKYVEEQKEEVKPTPRIYIEDNDPEFDDLDEEDPDDDLDI
mmetsp:Transcript_15813/g.23773  ORF Transcript_15813/g.23773 Transcript_15813/m.23773 type:complete len:515 (+) Transcript_15813:97-1641(+)